MLDTDVVVCGGGPAGLAAAIACRMQGLDVILLDCARPPVEKACGEGLLPEAVSALERLGIDLRDVPGTPLLGIAFKDGDKIAVQGRFRNGAGFGVKRTHLHSALCQRAQQIGIRLHWETYVTSLHQNERAVEVSTRAGVLRARWCIGADGLQSQVRRWCGLGGGTARSTRVGLRKHYAMEPWSSMTEVYWGRSGQAYVTPVAHNELGVAIIRRATGGSFEAALDEFPELRDRVGNSRGTGTMRGGVTCNRTLRRLAIGRVALVGDASGSVDAITGAGLALAFQQALAVANALREGELSGYAAAHREIHRSAGVLSYLLLALDRFPALRRIAFASFRRRPELFEAMLALHSGATPFAYWGRSGALTLGLHALLG